MFLGLHTLQALTGPIPSKVQMAATLSREAREHISRVTEKPAHITQSWRFMLYQLKGFLQHFLQRVTVAVVRIIPATLLYYLIAEWWSKRRVIYNIGPLIIVKFVQVPPSRVTEKLAHPKIQSVIHPRLDPPILLNIEPSS